MEFELELEERKKEGKGKQVVAQVRKERQKDQGGQQEELEQEFKEKKNAPMQIARGVRGARKGPQGTFTNIRAIGTITDVLFFMFSCQNIY